MRTEIELLDSGLLRVRATVRNTGSEPFEVTNLEPALAVPTSAVELLDFTGRHVTERHPQRRPFDIGAWVRESWGGRSGHDSATLLCAGTREFGYRRGEVWGLHVASAGNQVAYAERSTTDWRLLRGGERLLPGEVVLEAGESYSSPWLVGTWGHGLDEASTRIHDTLRARPRHPQRPRPVLLNTWEATYYDHDLDHLLALADRAAEVGVERFVLDDGWFGRRRDDTRGLGDWVVSAQVWPDGLTPLVERVHALGMEFGLWVEPEMVNLDSELAETHPEWLLQTARGPGIPSRYQHVLDLTHPEAYAHVRGQISALVTEYGIAYLKWDHNRPLVDAGHWPTGRPNVHRQAKAALRLMADLKAAHPGLEIESCAGGGARIDLGDRGGGRPLLGIGLQRRPRTAPHQHGHGPDRAARAAGNPRRPGTRPQHGPPPRAGLPRRDGHLGAPRHRVGPDDHQPRRPRKARCLGRRSTSGTGTCSTPAMSCTPTSRTRPSSSTGSSRPTVRRRCTSCRCSSTA